MKWEQIRQQDPDILLVMPCGFAIETNINRKYPLLLQQPGFAELKAVKNNRVYLADGNQYFNRPGPRIVDSIEILAEIIHPKQFIYNYEGVKAGYGSRCDGIVPGIKTIFVSVGFQSDDLAQAGENNKDLQNSPFIIFTLLTQSLFLGRLINNVLQILADKKRTFLLTKDFHNMNTSRWLHCNVCKMPILIFTQFFKIFAV